MKTVFDLTVSCEDCGREIQEHYWTDTEPKPGQEFLACGSPSCEVDVKVVSSFGEADTYVGDEIEEIYPLEPDRWVDRVISGQVWVKREVTE